MKKHLILASLLLTAAFSVVSSTQQEEKKYQPEKESKVSAFTVEYHAPLPVEFSAMINDAVVPEVQGGPLAHIAATPGVTESYSPIISVKIRGPTTKESKYLLPFIRDKDRV